MQQTRNEGQEKGRKPEQETRGDAEETNETQRFSQHRVPRWKERAKPTGQRRVSSREVGEEPRLSTMKQKYIIQVECQVGSGRPTRHVKIKTKALVQAGVAQTVQIRSSVSWYM